MSLNVVQSDSTTPHTESSFHCDLQFRADTGMFPVWRYLIFLALFFLGGCVEENETRQRHVRQTPIQEGALHSVTVVRPGNTGRLSTEGQEISGSPVGIDCSVCHEAGSNTPFSVRAGVTGNYHVEVNLQHGELGCGSCHVIDHPSLLHSAEGHSFPIIDSMRLCSQCHNSQRRSYDHGAHGGMRGYWDLHQGPRVRNDCIVCHSAHSPAYPLVTPVPAPRDRFTQPRRHSDLRIQSRFEESNYEQD